MPSPSERCVGCGRRMPWLSFWGNLTLGLYKILVAVLGGSAALAADGMHSLSDVVGTSGVLVSRRLSERPADVDHPYGHGKAEFMASIFVYVILIAVACGLFVGGLAVIVHGNNRPPDLVTLLAAGVSAIFNWLMFRLGKCAATENRSPALMANAFESRADAIASVAVIVGIAAAVLIHPFCDPIAAMIVGVIIFVNCLLRIKEAVAGLMDEALPPDAVERIEAIASEQSGVVAVDYVRTRPTGTGVWVDLGIRVGESANVAQASAIARAVRGSLIESAEALDHVEVFVKPARAAPVD